MNSGCRNPWSLERKEYDLPTFHWKTKLGLKTWSMYLLYGNPSIWIPNGPIVFLDKKVCVGKMNIFFKIKMWFYFILHWEKIIRIKCSHRLSLARLSIHKLLINYEIDWIIFVYPHKQLELCWLHDQIWATGNGGAKVARAPPLAEIHLKFCHFSSFFGVMYLVILSPCYGFFIHVVSELNFGNCWDQYNNSGWNFSFKMFLCCFLFLHSLAPNCKEFLILYKDWSYTRCSILSSSYSTAAPQIFVPSLGSAQDMIQSLLYEVMGFLYVTGFTLTNTDIKLDISFWKIYIGIPFHSVEIDLIQPWKLRNFPVFRWQLSSNLTFHVHHIHS